MVANYNFSKKTKPGKKSVWDTAQSIPHLGFSTTILSVNNSI